MKADLHVHSSYSDSSLTMKEVFQEAKRNGVTHLSFVDHDTVAGLAEAKRLEKEYDVTAIPGIEISAYDFERDRKVHILGYNYDQHARHITRLCTPLFERRHEHTLWQIEQIKRAGYRFHVERVLEAAKPSTTIYKQHVMAQLTDAAYDSNTYQTLYRKLFKGEGPAARDIIYIDAFDAVEAIVADGGLPVVAHPGQLDSYELIPELVEVGLAGIELHHPDHTELDRDKVEALAESFGLFMTGGTDHHGSFGSKIEIGAVLSPFNPLFR